MFTEIGVHEEVLKEIEETVEEMRNTFSSINQNNINTIPYKDSWTAGQLLSHVTKSTKGMANALAMEAKPIDRDPGERIIELKNTFLDFSHKMKSPEFIVPETGFYSIDTSLNQFSKSFQHLKQNAENANLSDEVKGLPLGSISKLEILHFVFYHTQRHLHQLKSICKSFN